MCSPHQMDHEGCRGTGPYGDEASETDDENDEY